MKLYKKAVSHAQNHQNLHAATWSSSICLFVRLLVGIIAAHEYWRRVKPPLTEGWGVYPRGGYKRNTTSLRRGLRVSHATWAARLDIFEFTNPLYAQEVDANAALQNRDGLPRDQCRTRWMCGGTPNGRKYVEHGKQTRVFKPGVRLGLVLPFPVSYNLPSGIITPTVSVKGGKL